MIKLEIDFNSLILALVNIETYLTCPITCQAYISSSIIIMDHCIRMGGVYTHTHTHEREGQKEREIVMSG